MYKGEGVIELFLQAAALISSRGLLRRITADLKHSLGGSELFIEIKVFSVTSTLPDLRPRNRDTTNECKS